MISELGKFVPTFTEKIARSSKFIPLASWKIQGRGQKTYILKMKIENIKMDLENFYKNKSLYQYHYQYKNQQYAIWCQRIMLCQKMEK